MLSKMKNVVSQFCKREDGPTAVEYAVMLGLVIVVCVTAVFFLGGGTNEVFKAVTTETVPEVID